MTLLAAAPVDSAEARELSRQTTKQRTDNGHVRKDTWSNAAGKQASREATVVNNRENRSRTRDVAWTGPDGKQATRSAVVVNDKEAGTRTREVASTGPSGGTRTLDDQLQRTEDGYVRSSTLNRANGAVTTRGVSASYDHETKTWTKDVSVSHTPPAGDGG